MAVRHQLIERSPEELWTVLADGSRYQDWVVGTADSRPVAGNWPEVGSMIEYTVRMGPWELCGHTVVRRSDPPQELELEVDSGRLGTARVAIEVRRWGQDSLVIVDEHPLRGPGGRLHNAGLDVLLQLRHRSMLSRLADVAEEVPRGVRTGA
ncbi:SRPBCC family protein [Streptomyces sp. MCA2]|uniref:SRPBCC family protein n=1 Tax=Streptomyces sp. MCA2 TaxID=2944805 RepID=UPI002020FC1B|nr:SRPBCC family protein [Streptomyces sp. MCA2]MCL7491752.1 SRPBCC family protein [Streptomyces sp. MCA2]